MWCLCSPLATALLATSLMLDITACRTEPISAYRVQLGEKRIFDQTQNKMLSLVKKVVLHPNYDPDSFLADIGLVELENPIVFMAVISPVSLFDASVRVPAGKTCWVTGWGKTAPQENSYLAETLQELEVLTINFTVCNYLFQKGLQQPPSYNSIKDDMMCAGQLESYNGTAWGDSGGPLVCKVVGIWYLAGIVSWALVTNENGVLTILPGYPGVYNCPNAHNQWIQENVPGVTFTVVRFAPNNASSTAIISCVLLLTALLWLTI